MRPKLLIVGVLSIGLLAACGSSDQSRESGAVAGAEGCVSTPVTGSSRVVVSPPAPMIARAWHDAQRVYVDVRMESEPADCKPLSVRVAAFSEADAGNRAVPLEGADEYVALHDGRAHVVLRRPILDLPPYVAIASAYGTHGASSPTTRYLIPEKGDYCLRHHSTEQCVIEAQAVAKRCTRGEAPRAICADWAYASQRPYPATPVKGASVGAVEDNLRAVLERGTYNDVRLTELTCTRRFICTATFARQPSEGTLRVRYVLSGYHQEEGCWFATRIDVIDPPETTQRSPLTPFAPLNNQAWCLHWRTP